MSRPCPCPVCEGTGRLYALSESATDPCHACSGTGIVWEVEPALTVVAPEPELRSRTKEPTK